jgi:hypothetical protein
MPDKLYKNLTMKKVLIIFWCLILANNIKNAQGQEIISSDSLLKLFQVMKPFEVFEKVQFTWFDFKSCYNNIVLKPYLMKWLDRHEYFEFVLDKEKETITNRPDLIKNEIIYMLNKRNRKNALDSILDNPILYTQYRDSAISVYVNRYVESYKGEHKVPDRAIIIHSYLAYPESYTIIKQWWNESDRKTERNEYFIPLVRMGDPEARKLYDNLITQFVKTNGEIPGIMDIDGELRELRNSYSVAKMIEVLKIDMVYNPLEDSPQPYNCWVISYLLNDFLAHSIDIGKVKTSDPCDVQKKHLPEIKAAAQRLIEKYKAEEYYWMKNMPFYKEEQ